ncbi:MAG: sensor domain-containing diguanylate cyclase [Anaerolineales bacterium]
MNANALLCAIFESAQDSIFVKDLDLRYVQVNPAMGKLLNLPLDEIIGKTDAELFGSQAARDINQADNEVLRGNVVHLEDRIPIQGKLHVFSVVKTPLRDETGKIIGLCGIARDITSEKEYEQQLRESERSFRELFENASDLIQSVAPDGRFLFVNRAWRETLGYSEEDLKTLRVYDIFDTQCQDQCNLIFRRLLLGEKIERVDTTFLKKDGNPIELEGVVNSSIRDGKVVSTVGIFRDISERKRIEAALRESEERYRNIFETAGVSIWEEDFSVVKAALEELRAQGVKDFRKYLDEHPNFLQKSAKSIKVRDVNQTTMKMFGAKTKEELLGNLSKIFVPETMEILKEEILAIAEGKNFFEGETINQTLSGERKNIWLTITFPQERSQFHKVLVSLMDITKIKQAEREIELQRVYFQQLFENTPVAIAMYDAEDRLVRINQAFEKLFGYRQDEVVGKHFNELIIPEELLEEASGLSIAVFAGSAIQKETYRMRKDRTRVPVVVYSAPIVMDGEVVGGYAMYVDISDRKLKEQKLEYLSSHDTLTGLFNRAYFESELRRLEGERVVPVSILVGDVDGLKQVNDRLGHAMGDELLKSAALILKKSFRSVDVVARIGGDEFAIILPEANQEVAERSLERVREGIAAYNQSHPLLQLSISMGAATTTTPIPLSDLMREADRRMYDQKALKQAR